MNTNKQSKGLTPEEQESHNAIVKAILSLIQMIISFFVKRKNNDKTKV